MQGRAATGAQPGSAGGQAGDGGRAGGVAEGGVQLGRRQAELAARLSSTRFADVRVFATIDSTNTVAVEAGRAGVAEGLLVVADHQTAGRGRLSRTWWASPGSSLLASVLLRPAGLPADMVQLVPAAAALAGVEALDEVAGVAGTALKWPNDVIVGAGTALAGGAVLEGERKLAGILTEVGFVEEPGGARPGRPPVVDWVVVGIGVNLVWPPVPGLALGGEEAVAGAGQADGGPARPGTGGGGSNPGEVPADVVAGAIAANHVSGRTCTADELAVAICTRLDGSAAMLATAKGRIALASAYRSRCATLGRRVRITLPGDELVEGVAADVSPEGHLLVDVGACLATVTAGDVVHLRDA